MMDQATTNRIDALQKRLNREYKNMANAVLNAADPKELKLIDFALHENSIEQARQDLAVKFSSQTVDALIYMFTNYGKEAAQLIQNGLKNNKAVKEATKHDPSRPFVGQVLYANLGYSCDIIVFYQVVKVTKCYATIVEVGKKHIKDCDGYGQQTMVVPDLSQRAKQTYRRKIQQDSEGKFAIAVNSYNFARAWNGKEIYEDTLD